MKQMLHRITDAIERDIEGRWKGVVVFDKESRRFFRYLDSYGVHKEWIA